MAGFGNGVGHDFVVLFEPVHVEGEPAAALLDPCNFQFGESVEDAAGDEADDGEGGVDAHEEVFQKFVVEAAHADGLVELLVDGDGHAESLAFFQYGPELFLVGPLALELAGDVGAAEAKVCGASEFLDGHVDVVEGEDGSAADAVLVAIGPLGNPVVPALGEVVGDLGVVDGVKEVLVEDAEDEGDVEAFFVEVLDAELGVALAFAVVPLIVAVGSEVGQLAVGTGAEVGVGEDLGVFEDPDTIVLAGGAVAAAADEGVPVLPVGVVKFAGRKGLEFRGEPTPEFALGFVHVGVGVDDVVVGEFAAVVSSGHEILLVGVIFGEGN